MNLTYKIISNEEGYIIMNNGVDWVLQDSFIPFPGETIQESAQNHINQILADFNRPQEITEIEKLKEENNNLKASQTSQDELIMSLMLGGA